MSPKGLLPIFAGMILGGPAYAVPLKQTKYFSGAPTLSGIANFYQFNTDGGSRNLNSVQIDISLDISGGQLTFDNDGLSPADGNLQFGAAINISSTTDVVLRNSSNQLIFSDGMVYTYNLWAFNLNADNGDGKGNYDSASPDGAVYIGSELTSSDSGLVGNDFWNSGDKGFIGTGSYDIGYSVVQWIDYGTFNDIEYAGTSVSAAGSITVIYDYDQIPEPVTITLLSTGALVIFGKK